MNQHHELGFKQFAGRGLRYVTEWHGQWGALAGWRGPVPAPRPIAGLVPGTHRTTGSV